MMKKICAIILVLCLATPCAALAAQKISFDARVSILPDAFPQEQKETAQALKTGLDMLSWKGEITTDSKWYALNSDIMLSEKSAFTLDVRSTSRWRELSSNLLGDEKLSLFMDAYLEFMMKPYNFMGVPTQYFALLSSRYAHVGAWEPLRAIVAPYFEGEGTRTVSKESLMAMARQASEYAELSRDLRYWFIAALMDIGLDDTVYSFFLTLPDWVEEVVGESGLVIREDEGKTVYLLDEKTVLIQTHSAQGSSAVLTLPEWEGYRFKGSISQSKADFAANFQLSSDDEGVMLDMQFSATNLPSREKKEGETLLSFAIGGDYVNPIAEKARLHWVWDTENDLETVQVTFDWLNGQGEPKMTLSAHLALEEGDSTLLNFQETDLQEGTHFFSIYEETLKELVDKVKGPVIQIALPVYMDLPIPFIKTVAQWLKDVGMIDMLLDNITLGTADASDE